MQSTVGKQNIIGCGQNTGMDWNEVSNEPGIIRWDTHRRSRLPPGDWDLILQANGHQHF